MISKLYGRQQRWPAVLGTVVTAPVPVRRGAPPGCDAWERRGAIAPTGYSFGISAARTHLNTEHFRAICGANTRYVLHSRQSDLLAKPPCVRCHRSWRKK